MSGSATYNRDEADQLDRLTADLSAAEWDQVWNVYVERGYDSAALVAQQHKSRFKARYKVIEAAPPAHYDPSTDAFARMVGADQAKR